MHPSQFLALAAWLPLVFISVTMAMSVYSNPEDTREMTGPRDVTDSNTIVVKDKDSAKALIDQLLGKESETQYYNPSLSKRYYPRSYDIAARSPSARKRHDGLWIWMPAQGYVSVPKDEQFAENDSAAKHGKIMRYGRKRRDLQNTQ